MRFLLDECMPRSSREVLRILKYNVLDAREADLLGKDDRSYLSYAIKTKRILITLDRDFANILLYRPGTNPGIIVLRPLYPSTSLRVNSLLCKFLRKVKKVNIEKSLTIVTPTKIKIRR